MDAPRVLSNYHSAFSSVTLRIAMILLRIVIMAVVLAGLGIAETLPTQFFGISVLHATTRTPWPQQPYAGIRLWDTDGTGWPQLNPARGRYDWKALDRWLSLAKKHNVDVLYTFGRVPAWANGGRAQSVPPTDFKDWEAFVRAIAKHSNGRIKFWEIWNEPNEPKFWSGDIATLVTMAKCAERIIKSIDPKAIVLTPSATWTTTSPAQWFEQYFAAGGGKYADVIAFHGYVGRSPEGIASNLRQIQEVAAKFGLNKPFWNTEASWGMDERLTDPINQANFLARFYILQVSQGVQRFYWYAWDGSDGRTTRSTNSWGTLWDSNGTTPAATAYTTVRAWLLGTRLPLSCNTTNSLWQCPLSATSTVIWNTSAQQKFRVEPRFIRYYDLAGQSHMVGSDREILIGPAPILLKTN